MPRLVQTYTSKFMLDWLGTVMALQAGTEGAMVEYEVRSCWFIGETNARNKSLSGLLS